jgi:type VI secretion system FHA domain protein
MPIKINITLSSGGRFKPVDSVTLRERRITVGRDDTCTLSLEDTQKHVSRVHAEFEEEGGRYWMKVVSKVNPVIVNGTRHMFGERVEVAEGDTLAIGLYRLEIQAPEVPAAPPPAPLEEDPDEATYVPRPKALAPIPAPTPVPAPVVEDDEKTYVPSPPPPAAAMDPMDRVAQRIAQFRKQSESTLPSSAPAPSAPPDLDFDLSEVDTFVPQQAPAPAAPTPPPARIAPPAPPVQHISFEEDNSEEATMLRAPPPAAPAAPPVVEEFDDEATMVRRPGLAPPAAPVPIAPAKPVEEEFDADATMVRRPGVAPTAKAAEEEFDPEATMVRRPGSVPPPPPAPPRVTEEFDADATMVRRPGSVPPPPLPAARPVAPAPVRPARAGGDPLLDAFLGGAGLGNMTVPDPQAFMRDSGALVRVAIDGIVALMAARAETRRELGADAAEPDAGDNPLQAMTDPQEILAFLFDPRRPQIPGGDPATALGETCADLRTHQAALSVATKAAVAGAIGRLDPKNIERDHGKSLGGLNLTRKSKLWDLSIEQHEKLAREMLDDFNAAFGREIVAAYLAHVRKVRGGR